MTELHEPTYVAQLTLTVPDAGPATTVTVTLAPADTVTAGGRTKPLADCTLAELRAYAGVLEAEVWDTYQSITLRQLEEELRGDVQVNLLDENGQAAEEVEDWLGRVILLDPPARAAAEETAREATEPPTATAAPEPPSVEPKTPEPVAAGPLAEAPKPATPEPEVVEPPHIIPSQARVRVAGTRLPLALSGGAAVDILLDEAPLRAMQAHALSSLDREVAGVMVGHQPEKQPDGRYVVHVIDSIIAKHTVMHGASVTYTPESWRYLNDTLWERYPDESAVMLGWYHTHPGFGIFLSGMDLFIHQNFFTQIWHVAYVLDPRARTSGFFCWNRQKTKVNRYDFTWPEWAAGSW